ncbi:helix-turn-helix domain-containing protein [Foetidibacter luteolus]|uniref:helix-turn-helix domain-containing protein n=1 Tax=Foetidibacter luteolus TaxID=2608880 RepID=UPI00129BF564|nr:AraC family transcriptional regulator [Foetidibacter luteolus]
MMPISCAEKSIDQPSYTNIMRPVVCPSCTYLQEGCSLRTKENDNNEYIVEQLMAAKEFMTGQFPVHVPLATLCRKSGLNRQKLQRGFKGMFGKTIGRFQLERRMETASNLLGYTDKAVKEIAVLAGYSSAVNLCAAFKSYYKLTPLMYRRQCKQDNKLQTWSIVTT